MDLTPIKTKLQRPNLTSKHSEFLGKLLHSRNVAHLVHLNTNSYAKHKALNKYYESILDLFDDLAEISMGSIGKQSITVPEAKEEDIDAHLRNLKVYIEGTRSSFGGSHLQNIIDEIVALIDHTIYLLTLN